MPSRVIILLQCVNGGFDGRLWSAGDLPVRFSVGHGWEWSQSDGPVLRETGVTGVHNALFYCHAIDFHFLKFHAPGRELVRMSDTFSTSNAVPFLHPYCSVRDLKHPCAGNVIVSGFHHVHDLGQVCCFDTSVREQRSLQVISRKVSEWASMRVCRARLIPNQNLLTTMSSEQGLLSSQE